jgi:outer membrane murein-binding lipoprotein Lpp
MNDKTQADRQRRYLAGLRSSRDKTKELEQLVVDLQATVDEQAEEIDAMKEAMQRNY